MRDFSYCREMLDQVSDMLEGVASVNAYDQPNHPRAPMYQIFAKFKFPISQPMEIDKFFNSIYQALGEEWRLSLSVDQEPLNRCTTAKLCATTYYSRGAE